MTARLPSPNKRKAHQKSRKGCGNCKLRKVKCDEFKPRCKRCTAYGVVCSYGRQSSDLQLSVEGVSNLETLQELLLPRKNSTPSMIVPQCMQLSTGFELGMHDLELLSKFKTRTGLTISTASSLRLYQEDLFKLACSHPFLMHAALLVTRMHDRYLSAAQASNLSVTEATHWHQSVASFKRKMCEPIRPSERDALWATSAILATISFFYIEAKIPEEAWPLTQPSSSDLNWLKLSDGKRAVWSITQPLRSDGTLRALALEHSTVSKIARTATGLESLPPELLMLCGLDRTSPPNSNPYFAAASTLAQAWDTGSIQTIFLNFFCFITTTSPEYRVLLERKDHRALLLLAYWYAKVCQTHHWWALPRAALECQAICIYLSRYCQQDTFIQQLLQYPRTLCGISA